MHLLQDPRVGTKAMMFENHRPVASGHGIVPSCVWLVSSKVSAKCSRTETGLMSPHTFSDIECSPQG